MVTGRLQREAFQKVAQLTLDDGTTMRRPKSSHVDATSFENKKTRRSLTSAVFQTARHANAIRLLTGGCLSKRRLQPEGTGAAFFRTEV